MIKKRLFKLIFRKQIDQYINCLINRQETYKKVENGYLADIAVANDRMDFISIFYGNA